MFKVGDYVMGLDRSYLRSLYRVHKIVNDKQFDLEFIRLGLTVGKPGEMSHDRYIKDFGLASALDIKISEGWEHVGSLVRLLDKLEIKKSYLELL